MISNIDINRRKTNIYNNPDYSRFLTQKTAHIDDFNRTTLSSSAFSKTMSKIVKKYASGVISFRLHFLPRPRRLYISLLCQKFNSYDFESMLFYDYLSHEFFFKLR